jgi:predicted permease
MSLWSRIANIFHGERLSREIDEELASHIDEAIAQGRSPEDARRAFGSPLSRREECRDIMLITWLDSIRADIVFGWRQLKRKKVTSAAAILSLALAIGACTSAFRLIDALLLRPLPVAEPERLYALARQAPGPDAALHTFDGWAYPAFGQMRAAVEDQAELFAVSYAERMDLTYGSDREIEKACLQYVSGSMFDSLGLQAALGRLFTRNDDLSPGAHPYAVLSHDYWAHRFGQDPKVIGRTFRMGDRVYEIVGVGPERFTGTETGTVTDVFLPTMMHSGVVRSDWTWHRTLARLKSGVAVEPVRARLHAASRAFEEERAKGFTGMTKQDIDRFLDQTVVLEPAAAGASSLRRDYRRPLVALGGLVALVLLIACANVANLMTAQAAARSREMALRVSIGAGRWRLIQMVLAESAMLALLAAAMGGVLAWWSAPFVVGQINPPDNPVRLALPAGWRVLGFGVVLTLGVTCLFGLAPALRASAVSPVSVLKGGSDRHSRRRPMHALIAVQVAFCFLVLFAAGLFAATFERLSNRPIGFSAERLLTLDTVTKRAQAPVVWDQVAEHIRAMPGVEAVAIAGWPLTGGNSWNGFVSIKSAPPGPELAYFLNVSPGWTGAMKIPFIDGRDFRASDTSPGVAIINETFAKQFFNGESPIGQSFAKGRSRYEVVGLVRDAPYRNLREPILPVAYVPFHPIDANGVSQPIREGTFIVRSSSSKPLTLASILRQEVARAGPGFRVSRVRTQTEINQAHTARERLLAIVALFFAVVAVLLAGVGLYGVLHYSVLQRRREIGIRIALGARAASVARRVTRDASSMVLVGAFAGLVLGLASARYVGALLYDVKATDLSMLALPSLTMLVVACLAAMPAVIHAVRVDPVSMLRAE